MNKKIRFMALCMAAGSGLLTASANAQAPAGQQVLFTRALAASCANCHGTDGRAVEGSQWSAGRGR